jgi:hypothetical protein
MSEYVRQGHDAAHSFVFFGDDQSVYFGSDQCFYDGRQRIR